MSEREKAIESALMEFVKVENAFGHTGQHGNCADCARVRKSNEALLIGGDETHAMHFTQDDSGKPLLVHETELPDYPTDGLIR